MAKVIDTHGSDAKESVGFDLDGTLAKYDGWKGVEHIGDPIPSIEVWCEKNLGFVPEITYQKDPSMICFIDDRACTVEQNTGKLVGGFPDELLRVAHT